MINNNRCILIVDDEIKMIRALEDFLKAKGFILFKATDGIEAINIFNEHIEEIDVVLLDVMMPKLNGIETLKELRKLSFTTPVIMLTAKSEEYDQVSAFSYGADDYVTKPFSITLLLARIEATLRRFGKNKGQHIVAENIVINPNERNVVLNNVELELTRREYDLLYYLVINKNQTFSREQLLNNVWGYNFEGGERTVDTHIRQLRQKLNGCDYIKTVHCMGYRFEIN